MPITDSAATLKWYLSGGAANANPDKSLGGARSMTQVAGGVDNLFDDVTSDEVVAGEVTYRCMFFRNEDPNASGLAAAVAWINQQSEAGDVIAIGIDPAGKNAAAATPVDEFTAPAGVAFSTPLTSVTGLALPGAPYLQNDYIAIWVRRTVSAGIPAATALDQASVRIEGTTV